MDSFNEFPNRDPSLIYAFRAACRLFWPVLKSRFFLFFGLQAIAFIGAQYFRYVETLMSNQVQESLPLLATNAGLSISFDLIWHSIFFMISVITALEISSGHSILPKRVSGAAFNELLIENTRVMARVIFWLPFFLLPALYKYVRLSMVSFIVLIDRDYDSGNADALKRSAELTRGRFFICFFALMVAGLLEPLATGVITGGEVSILRNPVGALIAFPVALVLQLWGMIFLFAIYAGLAKLQLRLN